MAFVSTLASPRLPAGRYDGPLWRFVFLSMLLHALAILLFGAPSGGTREGRAMWGSLEVVIRDSFRDAAPTSKIERAPAAARPAAPTPPAQAVPAPPAPPPLVEPSGVETPPPLVEPPRLESPPAVAVPPMLQRLEPKLEAPEFQVPKASEIPPPGEARIEVPALEATPLEPMPAPAMPRQLAEPPRIEAPLVQPIPIEAAPMERVAAPRVERQLAEPPRIEAPIAQPVETPALPTPRKEAAPAIGPAPPMPAEALPSQPPVPAPPRPAEALPSQPPVPAPPTPSVERAAPPVSPAPAPREASPRIERDAAPAETPASPFRPAPSGPSRAPPSDYDPTAPALDADALRKRAGEITRQGTGNRALLPFPMPPVEKPKTKMETAIENARKPDCRTAYQSLGLAAVVPLIANEFGEGTCRW